jgi:hypothetical protein
MSRARATRVFSVRVFPPAQGSISQKFPVDSFIRARSTSTLFALVSSFREHLDNGCEGRVDSRSIDAILHQVYPNMRCIVNWKCLHSFTGVIMTGVKTCKSARQTCRCKHHLQGANNAFLGLQLGLSWKMEKAHSQF